MTLAISSKSGNFRTEFLMAKTEMKVVTPVYLSVNQRVYARLGVCFC